MYKIIPDFLPFANKLICKELFTILKITVDPKN